MTRLAILISGRGSNMLGLAKYIVKNNLDACICIVISNKHCEGIERAAKLGLPHKIIEQRSFHNRDAHNEAIQDAVVKAGADLVFLAGYMAVLSVAFTKHFSGKLVNIHPSLLPSFRGLNTHQRAIDAKVESHGTSVHLVNAALDDGPIIIQAQLPLLSDDTANSLASRVLHLEHHLYPFVLGSLVQGYLELKGNCVDWLQPDVAFLAADTKTQHVLGSTLCWPLKSITAP